MRWRFRLLCLVLALGLHSCSPTPAIVKQTPPEPRSFVHLVADLGSSGTRLCLYEAQPLPGRRGCSLTTARPVCSRVKGGLARMTRGHREGHVASLVEPQLRRAWELLGDPAEGGDPALRSRVRAAVALGTGGFRDRDTGQPISRPEWQEVFSVVEHFIKQETGIDSLTARPITGEEEGRLAFLGLSQGDNRPTEFAAVEAGGATVQLAVGRVGPQPGTVEVATDPLGQDLVFERFVSGGGSLARSFQSCYNPRHPRRQDGARCIDLLTREVFQNSAVRRLAEHVSPRRLFGLGLSFADLFRSYPAAPPWPRKDDAAMHEKLSLNRLRQLTVFLCPMPDAEIHRYAPNALALRPDMSSGVATGAGRACYYLAYRAALLAAVEHVATGSELYSAEEDQWPRGAAVSGDFFPACRL